MKGRSKSISILNLQQILKTEAGEPSSKKFKPFVNERNLGKLIQEEDKGKKSAMTIEDINFKNFKAIYKR